MSLEVIINGKKYDSARLADETVEFVRDYIIYPQVTGESIGWIIKHNPVDSFLGEIAKHSKNPDLSDDEKKLVDKVSTIYSELQDFKKKYLNLEGKEREKYSWNERSRFAELIKPLYGQIDNYMKVCSLTPFSTDKDGKLILPSVFEYGKGNNRKDR